MKTTNTEDEIKKNHGTRMIKGSKEMYKSFWGRNPSTHDRVEIKVHSS